MRLWAVQLRVPSERAGATIVYPQFVVEAGDRNQAAERAKERLRQETPGVRMEEITVQATAEIGLENIWVFNDAQFRRVD